MVTNETTGKRIKRLRKRDRLTQEELASLLNVERVTISRYEHDIFTPKPEHLHEMAEQFNCSIAYILCKTDDPINYEDGDLIASINPYYIELAGGDIKKALQIQKAVDADALREETPVDIVRKALDLYSRYQSSPEPAQGAMDKLLGIDQQPLGFQQKLEDTQVRK